MSTDRRQYVERWYKNGKSAADIARHLSQQERQTISRNAVIGIARRAGLCTPRNPDPGAATALRAITLPLGQTYDPATRQLSPRWPERLKGGRDV